MEIENLNKIILALYSLQKNMMGRSEIRSAQELNDILEMLPERQQQTLLNVEKLQNLRKKDRRIGPRNH